MMQNNCTTTPKVNKVRIVFTRRKMTAYGGFALIAAFFERICLTEMIEKAGTDQGMFPEWYRDIRKGYCLFCHGICRC